MSIVKQPKNRTNAPSKSEPTRNVHKVTSAPTKIIDNVLFKLKFEKVSGHFTFKGTDYKSVLTQVNKVMVDRMTSDGWLLSRIESPFGDFIPMQGSMEAWSKGVFSRLAEYNKNIVIARDKEAKDKARRLENERIKKEADEKTREANRIKSIMEAKSIKSAKSARVHAPLVKKQINRKAFNLERDLNAIIITNLDGDRIYDIANIINSSGEVRVSRSWQPNAEMIMYHANQNIVLHIRDSSLLDILADADFLFLGTIRTSGSPELYYTWKQECISYEEAIARNILVVN